MRARARGCSAATGAPRSTGRWTAPSRCRCCGGASSPGTACSSPTRRPRSPRATGRAVPACASATASGRRGRSHGGPMRSAALLERFAERLGARVRWTSDGEEHLVERLEAGELDVVAGGLTKTSPWNKHAALTRPYDGEHVMATRLGENAWLVRLERFLLEEAK